MDCRVLFTSPRAFLRDLDATGVALIVFLTWGVCTCDLSDRTFPAAEKSFKILYMLRKYHYEPFQYFLPRKEELVTVKKDFYIGIKF